jgi:TonB-dependent receptor
MKIKLNTLLASASAFGMLGIAAPAFAQDQQANANDDTVERIIVEGRRGAIESALEQERSADALTSVVTADDIGNFGDPSVAESLQRISGVSINRVGGEGQQVSIRGLPTEFATVTLDGRRLGTSDADINSTNLDFFSADNLSGIEVVKALTPEQDADAIAGSVNLRSSSAFQRGEDTVGGRLEYGYQEKNEAFNPKISGDFTRLFDLDRGARLGLAGGLTWQNRETFTDEIRVGDGLRFVVDEGTVGDPDFDDDNECDDDVLECYLQPNEIDLRNDIRDTTRLTLNGAIELEFGETFLALTGSYSDQDSDNINNRQTFAFDRSTNNREIIAIGATSGILEDSRTERRIRPISEEEEVYTIGLDGETDFGDGRWTASYGLSTSSNERMEDQIEGRFRADDVRFIWENLDIDGIDITLEQEDDDEDDPQNPADYGLNNDQINTRLTNSEDTFDTFYGDLERRFTLFDDEAAFKFGFKARSRERNFNFDRFEFEVAPDVALSDFDVRPRPEFTDLDIVFDPNFGRLETQLRSLVANGQPLSVEFAEVESREGDYQSEEDVLAGYGQLTFRPNPDLQVIAGLRVESTEYSSTGTRIRELSFSDDATDVLVDALTAGGASQAVIDALEDSREDRLLFEDFGGENDYTEVFPSVVLRWDAAENVVVRASYTEGIKRPEFREAAAIASVSTGEQGLDEDTLQAVINSSFGGQLTSAAQAQTAIDAAIAQARIDDDDPSLTQFVSDGNNIRNPGLDPLTAQNFDVSVSWYPNANLAFTAAAFYKSIENFIVEVGLAGDDVTRLGFQTDDGTATSPGVTSLDTFINGDEAEIYGIELNYYQAFRDLPSPWNGLFVEANATIADSEASAGIVDRSFAFPDQSDLIGNLSLGWENDDFSLRLASVYQGERLRGINQGELDDANDPAGDVLEDERLQFDISARWDYNDFTQFYFDGININDAEDLRYFRGGNTADNGPIVFQYENYGPLYQIGVRVRY